MLQSASWSSSGNRQPLSRPRHLLRVPPGRELCQRGKRGQHHQPLGGKTFRERLAHECYSLGFSMTAHQPRTPILIVLLIVSILVAAVSLLLADHIQIATSTLEPLVTAALIAAAGGTRLFIR